MSAPVQSAVRASLLTETKTGSIVATSAISKIGLEVSTNAGNKDNRTCS